MSSDWRVIYYVSKNGNNPIRNFLDNLSPKQQAKILRIFMYIKEYGLQSVVSHVKKLSGTQLWEIRVLGQDNIRVFYGLISKNGVLILHGFIKKKQKTPEKEIDLALKRYSEWQSS
ncbi:MAG: type II toxin-antitoxin system RelE/ParE family toxin [Candidatus Levybacteria bacterium]|nr:type II toxin-antitoxin system RelE/ParE family toxin [Candidatus Levybacteria bacterium]